MSGLRSALRELPDAVYADLLESDDEYLLVVDVPGVTADTLDLHVSAGRLSIEARRDKSVDGTYRYLEEGRDPTLDADLPLPPDATAASASASVDSGVLEVTLPKRTAVAGTDIDVEDA